MAKRWVVAVVSALSVAALTFAGQASAEENAPPRPGTVTLKVTTVQGRAARPSVVIEIARARPEIKLSNLQDPAVEKVLRARTAGKAPF